MSGSRRTVAFSELFLLSVCLLSPSFWLLNTSVNLPSEVCIDLALASTIRDVLCFAAIQGKRKLIRGLLIASWMCFSFFWDKTDEITG